MGYLMLKVILVEEKLWQYLTHSLGVDKGILNSPNVFSQNLSVIVWEGFELT